MSLFPFAIFAADVNTVCDDAAVDLKNVLAKGVFGRLVSEALGEFLKSDAGIAFDDVEYLGLGGEIPLHQNAIVAVWCTTPSLHFLAAEAYQLALSQIGQRRFLSAVHLHARM